MFEDKVSVIIPLYNVEKYIAQCIESILQQHHTNFEVIVINDGSTDSSAEIVKTFISQDSRVKLFNQDNAGVSAARNAGLDKSSGEYVVFIDADDFIAPEFLDYMIGLSKKSGSDFCLSENAYTKNGEEQIREDNIRVLDPDQAIALLLSPKVIVGCWNKIYRRSFLLENGLNFSTSLFYGEGLSFITKVADKAKCTCVGKKKVYYYRRNNEVSATSSFNIEKLYNGEKALETIEHSIIHFGVDAKEMLTLHRCIFSLGALTKMINNNTKKEYMHDYKKWKRYLIRNSPRLCFSSNVSLYRKALLIGGCVSPYVMSVLDRNRRKVISANSFE